MNQEDIEKWVGKIGIMALGPFEIEVKVKELKSAYGNLLLLVEPVAGYKQAWVRSNKVELK